MQTKIVGILNYTPNSFSDGGDFFDLTAAQKHFEEMLEDGANIIDIGSNSTSYNRILLSAEEEWSMVQRLLHIVAPKYGHLISLDTFYSENAEKAVDLGVHIINDVGAAKDQKMIDVIEKNKHTLYVFMCSIVLPANKEIRVKTREEIYNFAKSKLDLFQEKGIESTRVIFDPGIGFATNPALSLKVIAELSFFKSLNVPIYIGHSRKSFLEFMTKFPPQGRDIETLAASLYMILQGVDYLRVHNVNIHVRAMKILEAMCSSILH
ncbi:MAG: dihydropteroate synthase [Candidatus Midichloria sp.]|nr:MAG: dihydropteroate synthase [Candidatus Midichloria sp.]